MLASKDVVNCVFENEFTPEENITRVHLQDYLIRAFHLNEKADSTFYDVGINAY